MVVEDPDVVDFPTMSGKDDIATIFECWIRNLVFFCNSMNRDNFTFLSRFDHHIFLCEDAGRFEEKEGTARTSL